MDHIHIHDEASKTVYRLPSKPAVHKNRHGDLVAALEIEITRADNYQIPPANRWAYRVRSNSQESYSGADREKVSDFFMTANTPPGRAISEEEYERLREEYERQARSNKPPPG